LLRLQTRTFTVLYRATLAQHLAGSVDGARRSQYWSYASQHT
jgi:hypothetical protein